jgi:resuscitation-promoting factor RpfB
LPGKHRARTREPSPPRRSPGRADRRPRHFLSSGRIGILVLTVALLGLGTTWAQAKKNVTLVVDGRPRTVETFSSTVGDVLDAEGILLKSHDEVLPPVDASLAEGMRIDVALAKEITLVLNGEQRSVWVTGATVGEVLEQINLRMSRNAVIEPSRGATVEPGDVIVYRDAFQVTVRADGRTRHIITDSDDVGRLLGHLGIALGELDRVEPRIRTPIRPGLDIRVIRVAVRRVTEEEAIGFDTRVRYSDSLYEGESRVEHAGVNGLRRRVYEIRTEDGREVDRKLLWERVVREPRAQIVVRGSKPRSYSAQSGVATWYERDGMVAAHKTLPFGTNVTVTNLSNGRQVTVVINDRGPYAPGRIIDLSDDAFAALAPLSRGTINVRITW